MVVLRIKEYENGEVALEYRIKRKERSMNISSGEVDMVSYHYLKLGTFIKGRGIIMGSTTNPTDIDASYDLIKTLSEVGERNMTDFTIELAVNYDENLETWIATLMMLFSLSPQDILLVQPGSN